MICVASNEDEKQETPGMSGVVFLYGGFAEQI